MEIATFILQSLKNEDKFKYSLKNKLLVPYFSKDTWELVLFFKGKESKNNKQMLEDILTEL